MLVLDEGTGKKSYVILHLLLSGSRIRTQLTAVQKQHQVASLHPSACCVMKVAFSPNLVTPLDQTAQVLSTCQEVQFVL